MPHHVSRQSRFLLNAAILALTLFASIACAAAEPTALPPPFKIARPLKIARPVETAEPTAAPPSLPTAALPSLPTAAPPTPRADTLPNAGSTAAVVPSALNNGLSKGAGQPPLRLVIPKMELDTGVREATWTTFQQSGQFYADWVIPYDAVGHLTTTANTGESGNMVISGHHNLIGPNQFGKGLFGGLWDLQVGDAVYLFDESGRAFAYSVSKSYNVKEGGEPLSLREQHAREILADTGEPILTLITCWNGAAAPYSGNTYRWIVAARLVNPIQPGQVPVIVRNPTPMQ